MTHGQLSSKLSSKVPVHVGQNQSSLTAQAGSVIRRGGIMGGAFLAARPNSPFFLYDLADKRVILESVQRVLDAGAQRLYTGHGGPLPRQKVVQWLATQRQKEGAAR